MKIPRIVLSVACLFALLVLPSVRAADQPVLTREQRASLAELRKEHDEVATEITSLRQSLKRDQEGKSRERRNGSTESRKEAAGNLNPEKQRQLQILIDRRDALDRKIADLGRGTEAPAKPVLKKP